MYSGFKGLGIDISGIGYRRIGLSDTEAKELWLGLGKKDFVKLNNLLEYKKVLELPSDIKENVQWAEEFSEWFLTNKPSLFYSATTDPQLLILIDQELTKF